MRTTVKDVMTREVASVNGSTPFKDIAEVLIAHGVSAVPVVDGDNHVIGVVSEADLLRKQEFRDQYYEEGYRPPLRARLRQRMAEDGGKARRKAAGDTAAALMTAPAVTVPPDASVVAAARAMDEHGVKRLVVVAEDGTLEGVVSRHDLLRIFVRPDADIADEIREDVLGRSLWADTGDVRVSVRHGIVTLAGTMERRSDCAVAVRMAGRVDGVVDVVDDLTWTRDDTPGPAR
ncbi:CBS domain-containing protein [Nonomuraea pusilla]|uniref:BON domain-containing protein n=1 Tax=Nonomuraea pusilla TaxID=46177 RepID=A0A1H8J470_9ACTN|nr:CBS domain-containing protein [Nonomuraea pusilla]SEN75245.1 BON domain-containing protein [Nonomuraea pusilla]